MKNPKPLRLLAATNAARGDLFTRLVKDLFFALGYEDLRLDVQKTGREIDIQGIHRFEPKVVLAECKALSERVGGAALNKFFGVLARERERHAPRQVAGYFVSLGGFTETGIEQELSTGENRLILLSAQQVIDELVRSRLLVNTTVAAERAGHCAERAGLSDANLEEMELLGHPLGYLWSVFYSRGKEKTSFALIHADGTPISKPLAKQVIDADEDCGGRLRTLQFLPPPTDPSAREGSRPEGIERYREWLAEECGYIQLDGLPTDTDLSTARLKLESLFVPLRVRVIPESSEIGYPPARKREDAVGSQPQAVGHALSKGHHNAFLAAPGGGKSTLLKHLALVYAFPERRTEAAEDLPLRDWIPLFLRCRELRGQARQPILELLDRYFPSHAAMSQRQTESFCDSIREALRLGRVLLLVDGLDEISDEGSRRTFAQHLRTFVGMFPRVGLVVTSRDAGFRAVAGVVSSICARSRLAPFDEEDIRLLCERWIGRVLGEGSQVKDRARELGDSILSNRRIKSLAVNPLLLTTLLVVKRWIGELPRSRVALYRETIRVLIRTWNVEGFTSLDEEETLSQLSYVACKMLEQGTQHIQQRELLDLLRNARRELEAELQFTELSTTRFVEQLEYRSSLLMQVGHELVDGELQPTYEFRHLTFQEYLAARGYAREQYPGRNQNRELVELLESRFRIESWREVIPLAAVLAGRKAEDLLKRLTKACEGIEVGERRRVDEPHVALLKQCLVDGVQVSSRTLRAALLQMARHLDANSLVGLRRGKYAVILRETVEDSYLEGHQHWEKLHSLMIDLTIDLYFQDQEPSLSGELAESLSGALTDGSRQEKIRAALLTGSLAYSWPKRRSLDESVDRLGPLRDAMEGMLVREDLQASLAASWALACVGIHHISKSLPRPSVLVSLYNLWRESESDQVADFSAWALATQPLLARTSFEPSVWGDCDEWLQQAIDGENRASGFGFDAAVVVAWYRQAPWSDKELVEIIGKAGPPFYDFRFPGQELLDRLAEQGVGIPKMSERA